MSTDPSTARPPCSLRLTLDGFEPTGAGLSGFVEFLLTHGPARPSAVRAQVRSRLQRVLASGDAATSGPWATAFELLLASDQPGEVLDRWDQIAPASGRTPASLLSAVVALHAGSGGLRVALGAGTVLADPVLAWLGERLGQEGAVLAEEKDAPSEGREPPAEPPGLGSAPGAHGLAARFLRLAALCGDASPAGLLLAALGVGGAEIDTAIDLLDEALCGPGAGAVLQDLGYGHPGFPGLLVYRFRDRRARFRLLAAAPGGVPALARALRLFLRPNLPVTTRASAQLYARLGALEGGAAGAGPRERLRLWVGPADAPRLGDQLGEEVRRGLRPPGPLLVSALRDETLTAHQRLALLSAARAGGGVAPPEVALAVHLTRTRLLREAGQLDAAVASAEEGLAWLESQPASWPGARGALHFQAGQCHRARRRLDRASQAYAEAAREAALPVDGRVDWHNLGACLAEAGRCLAERQEWAPAIERFTEAIDHLRRGDLAGVVHAEEVALVEQNLAACQAKAAGSRR